MSAKFRLQLKAIDIALLLYIVIQLAIVLLSGQAAESRLILFYITMAAIAFFLIILPYQSKRSFLHFIRFSSPLVLIVLFYRILDVQTQILSLPTHDGVFNSLEKTLLGVYPSFALQRLMEVWLNEISYASYIAGIGLPIWVILKLYNKRYLPLFENYILAAVLGGLICLIIISVYPTTEPGTALADYYYLNIYGPHFSVIVPILMKLIAPNIGSFPALYFCLLTVSAYYIWDFGKASIIISFIILAVVFWSGIYLRFHYIADALAALLIAFLASTIAGYTYYIKHERRPEGN